MRYDQRGPINCFYFCFFSTLYTFFSYMTIFVSYDFVFGFSFSVNHAGLSLFGACVQYICKIAVDVKMFVALNEFPTVNEFFNNMKATHTY